MRILHIDTEKGFRGGQGQVMHLMRGLRRKGVDQALVACKGGQLAQIARDEGFDVHEVLRLPVWAPGASLQLKGAIDRFAPTLLHAHSAHAHTLALAAVPDAVPVVVTRRVDFPVKDRAKYADRRVHWIAISRGVAEVLVAGGVDAKRITIVPSGVDPERATSAPEGAREELRKAWCVGGPGPVIGMVGSYVDHKDPLNLIEATPRIVDALPNAQVVFVGEGELRKEMEARANALGVESHVRLTGWRDDVPSCLAAFDLFVMPSKLEGLCTSLVDAQAAGLPCVACRTGGIPDVIQDGANGVLVAPEDSGALAEAIVALWKDEARRLRFSAAGPRVVEEKFTVERMVEGTLEVYREIPRRVVLESGPIGS